MAWLRGKSCNFTRKELTDRLKEANYDVNLPACKAFFVKGINGGHNCKQPIGQHLSAIAAAPT